MLKFPTQASSEFLHSTSPHPGNMPAFRPRPISGDLGAELPSALPHVCSLFEEGLRKAGLLKQLDPGADRIGSSHRPAWPLSPGHSFRPLPIASRPLLPLRSPPRPPHSSPPALDGGGRGSQWCRVLLCASVCAISPASLPLGAPTTHFSAASQIPLPTFPWLPNSPASQIPLPHTFPCLTNSPGSPVPLTIPAQRLHRCPPSALSVLSALSALSASSACMLLRLCLCASAPACLCLCYNPKALEP